MSNRRVRLPPGRRLAVHLTDAEHRHLLQVAKRQHMTPTEALLGMIEHATRNPRRPVRELLLDVDHTVRELAADARARLVEFSVGFALRYERMRPHIEPTPTRTGGPYLQTVVREQQRALVDAFASANPMRGAISRMVSDHVDRASSRARKAVAACRAALEEHDAWIAEQEQVLVELLQAERAKLGMLRERVDALERALEGE